MVSHCQIKFNRPDCVYFAGDTLSGVVEIEIRKKITIERLFVLITGTAETKWNDTETRTDHRGKTHTDNINYSGKEEYLNSTVNLVENHEDLLPGYYHYNFSCFLNHDLPSSTIEKRGSVKYSATVIFERSWKFNWKYLFDFTVIQPFNLSLDPTLKIPVEQEHIKTFCCLWCESKPVILTATLPMSGFVPGDNPSIRVQLDNPTDIEIHSTEIDLMKKVIYRSQTPRSGTKIEEYSRHKILNTEPIKNSSTSYEIPFLIPETVPSSKVNSDRIIHIFYEIQIRALPEGCHKKLKLKFPITIGTKIHFAQQIPIPTPTAPMLTENNFYWEPPPPSFEDAMKTKYNRPNSREIGFNFQY